MGLGMSNLMPIPTSFVRLAHDDTTTLAHDHLLLLSSLVARRLLVLSHLIITLRSRAPLLARPILRR